MSLYYFDASALVKYYVIEPGSTWVRQLVDEQNSPNGQYQHVILISEITRVEVAAGLAIIERGGRIRRSEREREYLRFISQLVHRYTVTAVTTGNLEAAARLTQQHPLKAYDAVQLATALHVHQALADQALTFVCGDRALLTAAQAEKLSVDNPFEHVMPQEMPGSSS
jgi:uncharacterized protein